MKIKMSKETSEYQGYELRCEVKTDSEERNKVIADFRRFADRFNGYETVNYIGH